MSESEGQAGTETNTAPDMVEVEGLRLPRLVLWGAERILVRWCEAEECRADREIIRIYRIVAEAVSIVAEAVSSSVEN